MTPHALQKYCYLHTVIFGGNSCTIFLPIIHFVTHWQSLLYTTEAINYQQIFFHKILHPSRCLHYPLSNKRHNTQFNKLRNHSLYSPPFARTQKIITLSRFTLSPITNKFHNYISISIAYLYF